MYLNIYFLAKPRIEPFMWDYERELKVHLCLRTLFPEDLVAPR